jgi:F-type H+-transporting ATPase subunit delta
MADSTTVARPYAKALFDLARSENQLAAWSEGLQAAAAVLADASAKRLLGSPALDEQKRAQFVRAVSVGLKGAEVLETPQGQGLLSLLAENDRLAVLPEIAAQFDALKAQAENKVKVKLTAATAVDQQVADSIARALEKRFGRAVELELEIDPSLLAGAVIRAEDRVIDGSVRTRLEQLTAAIVG